MTHPSNLDELVEVDKMRSMCLASDAVDNLVLVAADAVEGDIDMVASVPYGDQTTAADIDLMVMSCLRDLKKVFIEKVSCLVKMFGKHSQGSGGIWPPGGRIFVNADKGV